MTRWFLYHLTEAYPTVPPDIIIQSKILQPDDLELMKKHLLGKAKSVLSKPMLLYLLKEANVWLEKQGFNVAIAIEKGSSSSSSRPKGKKQKEKKKPKDKDMPEKKSPMKTADDVISRILWDEDLQTECFIVGYLDRFTGIVEKNFTAFSWEDIASVDYNVLAVPRHRIEYFKYKTLKVWDKPSRLDLVFGSTGSKRPITDIIKEYDENPENAKAYEDLSSTQNPLDGDDDDDIYIDTGYDVEGGGDNRWENKMRPNHFLCVRITNPDILEGVAAMQDALLEAEPHYAQCCIPPVSLHVTICTLGLDSLEQIASACQMLRDNKEQLRELGKAGIRLKIEKVDNFYKRVLYGKVKHGSDFDEFVLAIKSMLSEAGVSIRDNYEYVPHMTIMKTSRPVSRLLHTKDISPAIYEGFLDMDFGEQLIDGVHLCPMTEERGSDGFYNCLESVTFDIGGHIDIQK